MLKIILLFSLLFLQSPLFADRGLKLIKEMQEEQRVALVIGNDNYKNLATLKNPVNDARSMKAELKKRGFEVLYKENATKRDMQKLIKSFTYKLKRGGVGLYYFAGHGINVDGKNYLIATDSAIDSKEDVEFESYALNRITKKMQNAHNRLNIVILDACRNDPFSRGSGGGLAPIGDARGMFVAYATQAGNVASDGSSGHGVFTKNLIKYMGEKGAPIEQVFKQVRQSVQEQTGGKQSPGVYNQITGDFYFTLPSTTHSVQQQQKAARKALNSLDEKSTFTFRDEAPTTFSLTINPTPYDARVKITNIAPKYHDGIALKKGKYDIEVSHQGYITKKGSVNLQSDTNIDVVLKKRKAEEKSRKSYEPEMLRIPRGSFMMGSNDGEKDEKPRHRVTIEKDFLLGKYEVTVGQFRAFIESSGHNMSGSCWYYDGKWKESTTRNWEAPGFYQTEQSPVTCVSYNDATAYTEWLSNKTGKKYRLPSESEWEYAARAGSSTKYSFGDSDANLAQYAWYGGNSKDRTHKVGQKKPNDFGLYDMHGNVWEWCEDWYIDNYNNTPRNQIENNKGKKQYRVLRGGSWYDTSNNLRSAYRNGNFPTSRDYSNGFRLARTLP